VPVVVKLVACERLSRGGAAVEIVVEPVGLPRSFPADAAASFVPQNVSPEHLADLALFDILGCGSQAVVGAVLSAGLNDAIVFLRRRDHYRSFAETV